ncbi:hypothetical protein ACFY15_33185, partial [Streptomyces sp. NPDC001373]|uniref:hypothetical protein n=1 Tax=Streptomyces sp. NPDC001373 TaxID=3364565 RepID=UPI00367BDD6D
RVLLGRKPIYQGLHPSVSRTDQPGPQVGKGSPIGRIDFHTFGAYLSSPLTAAAISPFVRNPTIPDQIA